MLAIFESGRVERCQTGELPDCAGHHQLLAWTDQTPGLHKFSAPDYHRCQLEHWVWSRLQPTPCDLRVLDIGVYERRAWVGPHYQTFGPPDTDADVQGDLLAGLGGPWDVILCTEVLEHCADPFAAVRRFHEALAPGGRVLATSPFIWPDHRTETYPDYWRFTEQGWQLLFKDWTSVYVTPSQWTHCGLAAWHLLLDAEGMGFPSMVRGTTGYCVEATK